MRNKNRLYDEVSRMVELFESNNDKSDEIKKTIINKMNKTETIKEEINFGDLDDFDFGDGGDEDGKINSEYDSYSPNDDIPLLRKLALVTNSINGLQKNMFDLQSKDLLQVKDLYTKRVKGSGGEDDGAVLNKARKPLYSQMPTKEFADLLSKGRYVLKMGNNSEEVNPGDFDKLYKWLSTKSFNAIGLNTSGNVSKEGNATLNFLGRIFSNQPKGDDEIKILNEFEKSAKSNARNILWGWYSLVAGNIMPNLLKMKSNPESEDDVSEGVLKAIMALMGKAKTDRDGNSVVVPQWDSSRNLSPWFLQVVKNEIRNRQKKRSDLLPNISNAEGIFSRTLSRDGVISILSRKDPSHQNFADEVEEMPGGKYLYKYSKVEDALDDLKNSTKIKNHHMKASNMANLRKDKNLLYSRRNAPISMAPEDLESLSAKEVTIKDFDGGAEQEIRKILGDAVEFMSKAENFEGTAELLGRNVNKPEAVTRKQSTSANPDSKSAKAAKENLVNFLYNFIFPTMINTIGDTVTTKIEDTNPKSPTFGQTIRVVDTSRTRRDAEDSDMSKVFRDVGLPEKGGKIDSGVMKTWISSQNNKIMDTLKKIRPEQSEEELEKLAKQKGIWIKGDTQDLWNGLRVFLAKNPDVFKKMTELFLQTSAKGYEQELSKDSLEERVRAKIKKILKEYFVVKEDIEEEIIEDLDNKIKIFGKKFKKVTSHDTEELDNEIKEIINGGKHKWNYENSTDGQHTYISSVLASLYNSLSEIHKGRVVLYMFHSLFPNQIKSRMIGQMSHKYSGSYDAKRELVWDALMNPESNKQILIANALEQYEPKGYFVYFLQRRLDNAISNALRDSEYSYMKKTTAGDAPDLGQYEFEGGDDLNNSGSERTRVFKTSIDEPPKEGDDSSVMMLKSDEPEDNSEDLRQKLQRYLSKSENLEILSKSEISLLKAIVEHGDEVMEPNKINYELLGTKVGKSSSNVGTMMSNITRKMRQAREEGII